MDWASRYVLAWRVSNTLDARFCTDALDVAWYGVPEIFNTDQGSQFTSVAFTARRQEAGTRISMDGTGRFMDNLFIERLGRSLQYEALSLHEIADGFTARRVIGEWISFYNTIRPHSALAGSTPAEAYRHGPPVDRMDKPLRALPTYPTAAPRGSLQGDSGSLNFNRNTPWLGRQPVRRTGATSGCRRRSHSGLSSAGVRGHTTLVSISHATSSAVLSALTATTLG